MPEEGQIINNPLSIGLEPTFSCGVDGADIRCIHIIHINVCFTKIDHDFFRIKCHSFLSVYIQYAYFGRKKNPNKKALCNGNEGQCYQIICCN